MTDAPGIIRRAELYDDAPCGLALLDDKGLFLDVNRTLCEWLDIPAEELVGHKRLQDLFTAGGRIFHLTHWMPSLQMQGSLSEVKFDIRRSDGHTVPMLLNARRRVSASGTQVHVSMMIAEERNKYERELLLARKRADELVTTEKAAQASLLLSQAKLRQAIEAGALCLWELDVGSGRRRYGDKVALLLGFPTPCEVDESAFLAAAESEDLATDERAIQDALQQPGKTVAWSLRLNGIDGIQRTAALSCQTYQEADGPLTLIGVMRDITDTAKQLMTAQERAVFAEQMVGIVSHDLRNPLATILLGTTVLTRSDLAPAKRQTVERIASAAKRAQRLIADLLDFTLVRLSSGLRVAPANFDLHQLVSALVDELTLAFPGRKIELQLTGEGACFADADRLAQIVGNLVANAMTYGAPDSPVTITAGCSDGLAQLEVHNFGDPIPEQLVGALFEPMIRGVEGDSGQRSVGLGLFIVKQIAMAHGGEVLVRSSSTLGTSFVVRMLAPPESTEPGIATPVDPGPQG